MEERCHIKRRFKKNVALSVLILSACTAVFLAATEKYIMPAAADICLIQAKETANGIINSSVEDVLRKRAENNKNILSLKTEEDTTMIEADTVAINIICSEISGSITEKISSLENNTVSVPYGAASGIGLLANAGPELEFEIMQSGEAEVDYETEFTSAGINQTNYKIWLTVNITISLVNPLYDRKANLSRKIMLADTVIKGDLPSNYFNIPDMM